MRSLLAGLRRMDVRLIFVLTITLTIIVALVSIGIGQVFIPLGRILATLTGHGEAQDALIILNYRLPRILLALLVGAGLSVSGGVLQSLVGNPLASPDVIGMTKGAGLAACIVLILLPKSPVMLLPVAAFAGAALIAAAIYAFAYRRGVRPDTLALTGIALGALCDAGIQYLMTKYPVDVNSALVWLAGSLWGSAWKDVVGLLPWILVLLPILFMYSLKLDVLNLGDDTAKGLGENVEAVRLVLLAATVALVGACVAVAGSIGFVGLIAPQMARHLVGPAHLRVLPAAALLGGLLVLVADSLGRGVAPPLEIPAGLITAIIGAPYFFYLLRRRKR